jgi:hypothetical protein
MARKTKRADPIFAAIRKHQELIEQCCRTTHAREIAQRKVEKKHGRRPIKLVHWRGFQVSGREIDDRREVLLQPQWLRELGVSRKQIEKEFRAVKAKERAIIRAEKAWDRRYGLTSLRREDDQMWRAWHDAGTHLSKTKPTTPAGAGALIEYLRADLKEGTCDWHFPALETVAAALARMKGE